MTTPRITPSPAPGPAPAPASGSTTSPGIASASPMLVESRSLALIKPYENNPRTNLDAIEPVAQSIHQFGFRQPIVVDSDGVIICGHTRFKAAQHLGLTEVPVHVARDLTPEQIRAYRIADNKTSELASWDMDLLTLELSELREANFDWTQLGFDEDELQRLLNPGTDGLTDPNAVPPLPETPITCPGDIWILGNHRLICGDATNAEIVTRVLNGEKPMLMVTDPPYGVQYDPTWRADWGINKNKGKMGKVSNDDRSDWTEAWRLFPGDVAYVYHASTFASTVQQSLEDVGFTLRSQIIWAKDRMVLSRGDYHWQHEPCWYAVREGSQGYRTDDRTQTTLWTIASRDDSGHGHGTQKPVECMAKAIRNHTCGSVYDPFCGSGTTIIACEQLGRACYAIEIDTRYCDVIVKRWEQFTGRKASPSPRNPAPAPGPGSHSPGISASEQGSS